LILIFAGGIMANESKLPLQLTEEESLQELVAESDLVFVGVVLSLGKPPQNWSGFFTEYQTVKYRIDRFIKGQYGATEISVDHTVVSGSKTAAPAAGSPALSPLLFTKDAQLIVSARKSNSGVWKSLSENYGALPATPDWIEKIEHAKKR
jgi:hypothetical protein